MTNRTCPNCHHNLTYSNHFFCSNCGFVLPKELINKEVNFKVRTNTFRAEDTPVRKYYTGILEKSATLLARVSKKPLIELLLLLNLLAACFVLYEFLYPKFSVYVGLDRLNNLNSNSVPNPAIPSQIIPADEGVFAAGFGEDFIDIDEFASMYPNDIELFAVIPSIKARGVLFIPSLQSEFISTIENFKTPISFGVKTRDAGYDWVIVVKKIGDVQLADLFSKDFDFLEHYETNEYFLISNNSAILTESKAAIQKERLSLRNEASYALKVSAPARSKNGVIFLFTENIRSYFEALTEQPVLHATFRQRLGELINSSYNTYIIK